MRKPNRQFALLTFAGLGEVAAKELRMDSPANYQIKHLRNHDLVICSPGERQLKDLVHLRTAEDIFLVLGSPVTVRSSADLKRLNRHLVSGAILKALHLKNQMFAPDKPKRVTFKCFVKQDHDRRIQRHQIETAVNQSILNAFPRWRIADPASLELWAFYIEEQVWLGFRLTGESMRYHGREPVSRQGALRPTIAGAIATLSSAEGGETILDPMCGSGAILRELAEQPDPPKLMGGDIDADGIEHARAVLGDAATVTRWDARHLSLPDASVDCIVCNLPFGRQYANRRDLHTLYNECIAEWSRVLSPDGRMVLLTSQSAILRQALADAGFAVSAMFRAKVLGIWATIHQASRS